MLDTELRSKPKFEPGTSLPALSPHLPLHRSVARRKRITSPEGSLNGVCKGVGRVKGTYKWWWDTRGLTAKEAVLLPPVALRKGREPLLEVRTGCVLRERALRIGATALIWREEAVAQPARERAGRIYTSTSLLPLPCDLSAPHTGQTQQEARRWGASLPGTEQDGEWMEKGKWKISQHGPLSAPPA